MAGISLVSVERVLAAPVDLLLQGGLGGLVENMIADGEGVHLGPHEAR